MALIFFKSCGPMSCCSENTNSFPFQTFCITTFADHVNVNRLMLMAKEHKYKAVGSKNFWHKN